MYGFELSGEDEKLPEASSFKNCLDVETLDDDEAEKQHPYYHLKWEEVLPKDS